ncbi:N-acetyltransferase family protein [Humidisolicoccus flavus]|uniref:GNAT family N-acetyltransferase n=1 Tax=Humidisolicoccus flavus TaxID=3111414 RepID=UPI00324C6751
MQLSRPAITVRPATLNDAHAIARIHVDSWKVAYVGLVDQDVLDGLTVESRERGWAKWLDPANDERNAEGHSALVACVDGEPQAWATFGAGRDEHFAAEGELAGFYASPDYWGLGLGYTLIGAVKDALRDAGFARGYLWVLDGNERAAGFYERNGWTYDGTQKPFDKYIENRHVTEF